MMYPEFAASVKSQLRKDMNNYCDDMANGQCKSFDQYTKLCGVIQGLALAESIVDDLVKTLETAEDE